MLNGRTFVAIQKMRLFGFNISRAKPEPEQGEQRSTGAFNYPWGLLDAPYQANSGANIYVSQETALSVPAIWSAVKTIAETLAALPFDLYDKTDAGAALATTHPLYYLTKSEPDEYVTGYDFRRSLFVDACFGGALAKIYRNGVGRPVRFEYIPRTRWQAYKSVSGQKFYLVTLSDGNTEVLMPYEVLHIKGISLDGFIGEDVTKRFRTNISTSIAAEQFGNYFFGNGAHTDGIIKYPGVLDETKRTALESAIARRNGGLANVGKAMVLDGGMDYQNVGIDPKNAMLIETRNFQVNETARIFGIPAHLLQQLDRATFNNIETMNIQFVVLCLRPWAVQFEQEMHIKTLTKSEKQSSGYFYRLNLNGLLRGDTAARTAMYNTGITAGWLMRNEAREMEDLNKIEGLDKPLVQANMQTVDADGQIEIQQPQTDTTGAGTQTNDTANGTPKAAGE